VRGLVLAACLLAASACGFQLRGETATGLKSLYLSTDAPSQVATQIRRQLAGGPTMLAPRAEGAEAHLHILSESTEKTIQTLTSAGRVFDYVLRLNVGYRVSDGSGKAMIEPATLEVRRLITYSETAPLAKEVEERQLYADMRVEAATQILRRIAVVRANAP
jgi:LPS-assembly lipoprotein